MVSKNPGTTCASDGPKEQSKKYNPRLFRASPVPDTFSGWLCHHGLPEGESKDLQVHIVGIYLRGGVSHPAPHHGPRAPILSSYQRTGGPSGNEAKGDPGRPVVCLRDRVGFLRSGLWKERPNVSLQPQSPRWPEGGWVPP